MKSLISLFAPDKRQYDGEDRLWRLDVISKDEKQFQGRINLTNDSYQLKVAKQPHRSALNRLDMIAVTLNGTVVYEREHSFGSYMGFLISDGEHERKLEIVWTAFDFQVRLNGRLFFRDRVF